MATAQLESFSKRLQHHVEDMELELVINDNRSTMLNILQRKKRFAKLSVHKMFLDAPENVILAIARYVRGVRREKRYKDLVIRGYIQSNLEKFDYSHQLDETKFVTLGRFFDLGEIFDEMNGRYFGGKLDLKITWYGTWGRKNRSKVTFGQYFDQLKLIKIHRVLDDPFFPDYFVRFVVYHEMLHHIIPGFVDGKGLYRVHGPEFKKREMQFEDFERAIGWEKKHKQHFFKR